MPDAVYIPLSQYVDESLLPADLIGQFTGGFLDYVAYEDGHIFVEATSRNARLFLSVLKPVEFEFVSGTKAGFGVGKVQLEFTDNEEEWSFKAFVEKFHFEIAVLNIQQDIATMLAISKASNFQAFEFSVQHIVIGAFTVDEATINLQLEDGNHSGSVEFDITWDIIKNRLQALPANVPKPDNDATVIETLVEWDESDVAKSVRVNLKTELAELANAFFDFLPEDVRPEVLRWDLQMDVLYEGQGAQTGYAIFQADTDTSQLTGDIYADLELLLPEKLQNLSTDAFEVRFGDSISIIRARLAINDINSGDTKFHFDVADLITLIIHLDQTPGAEPLKIYFSRFSLDKATGSGALKLEGHFTYGNFRGASAFEFVFSPTTSTWEGDLTLGYYLDNFQVETGVHVNFGTVQTDANEPTTDSNNAQVNGKISFSKIKIGNDDIFAKLVEASFAFDYSRTSGTPDFKIQAAIDVLFQLSTNGFDSFLKKVLPSTPIQFPFQKTFDWSMAKQQATSTATSGGGTSVTTPGTSGVATTSSSANVLQALQQTTSSQRSGGGLNLSFPISIQKDIGGIIHIESLEESISLATTGITNTLVLNGGIKLGPLTGFIMGIGVTAEFNWQRPEKNLGFVDLQPSIVGPSGIGLSLDTSVVKAGGFLSIKPNEYIGALELEIKSIQLAIKAIAIINTNLPDGGFSLLVIITAEFNPIQLGYGFSLNGLGGLFGYKRSFQADELRLGLKTKALDSILFPKDVIANIGRIVTDLKRVFPVGNNFLIGPMVKIGWGTSLVTAELGILIQVPEPVIIAILGIIRLQLPDPDDPVVLLQINFLGVIDFEKKLFSLDASLSDSRILVMTITGDFALRIGWGSPAVFIFSSGGFHPDFKEAPVELQHMERLGIQVLNESNLKLGIDAYFALTTNTVQLGARAQFLAKSGAYTAVAEVGFDALLQFDPFFFTVAIYMTGRVTGPLIDIGIDVRGNLSGPNQWHVWGYAKAKVIGFEIEIPFDKTFGDPIEELSAGLQKIIDLLKEEVPKSANWKTITVVTGPPKISLRENNTGPDEMLIHPNTTLSFNQRVVPLQTSIEKFGNKGVDGDRQFSLSAVLPDLGLGLGSTPLYDLFAPGQFFNIPKDQQLSRPSFERFESGQAFTIITSGPTNGSAVSTDIDYEIVYIRRKRPAPGGAMNLLSAKAIMLLADGGAAAKSKFSLEKSQSSRQAPPTIGIKRAEYVVVSSADHTKVAAETFSNQTAAYNEQKAHNNQRTVVLSTHEL